MSGYQNNPEATAAVIDKDGFFDTGVLFLDGVFFFFFFSFFPPPPVFVAFRLCQRLVEPPCILTITPYRRRVHDRCLLLATGISILGPETEAGGQPQRCRDKP